MCGIVGYVGQNEARDILIDALRKLEYRGYDSAGIALLHQGTIKIGRVKGKVNELSKAVNDGTYMGTIGLAHTRWATHGAPSERNAHPHRAGDIVVVHNGIIENYMDLKRRLQKEGHSFDSDTDTEVIPHLILSFKRQGMAFTDAVRAALSELKGSYAVGVISETENLLIAGKKESPLILGIADGEYYIASDAPAILDRTNRFIFLEDDDMAVMGPGTIELSKTDGTIIERPVQTVHWSGAMAEKGGYKHFMLKEIHEQPRAISETLIGRLNDEKADVVFDEIQLPDFQNVRKIWMIACGTSFHACLIGKQLFETYLRIPVETDIASEFRYRDPIISKDDMIILVSQSGETADTIAAMKEGRRAGAYTLSICNVLGSTLAREADGVIFTHAGPEIGVASTKAFTTQISVLFMLMLRIAKTTGILDDNAIRHFINELRKIPHKIQVELDQESKIELLARKYMGYKDFLYIGRGISFPTVLEGALKLKEISYIHAEAYAAGEMKHGPIALIDENMPIVIVSPTDGTYQKTCSNIQEVLSRRGLAILFTDDESHEMISRVDDYFVTPKTIYPLQPILSSVPLQLFAYHIANFLGTDVDQPRNLAKSVTVE